MKRTPSPEARTVRALPVPHGPSPLDALPAVTSAPRLLPRLPAPPPSGAAVSTLVCLACAYHALPRVTAHHRMYA